jgi:hypothetical protein
VLKKRSSSAGQTTAVEKDVNDGENAKGTGVDQQLDERDAEDAIRIPADKTLELEIPYSARMRIREPGAYQVRCSRAWIGSRRLAVGD